MSPPMPCSCRALVPGAAPRDGRGHPLLSRVGVAHLRCLEDKAELVWGKPELRGMSPGPQVGPDLSPRGQLGPPEGQFL